MEVLGSIAVSTASQATRLGKGSSVTAQDEHMPQGSYYSKGSLEWILKIFLLSQVSIKYILDIHWTSTFSKLSVI